MNEELINKSIFYNEHLGKFHKVTLPIPKKVKRQDFVPPEKTSG